MNIRKYFNLSLVAAQNLGRYRAKSIAILVPIAIMMTVSSFMMFSRGGFVKDAENARDFLADVTVQGIDAGRVTKISLDIMPELQEIPHVKAVVPRVWGYIPLKIDDLDISYTLMGLDLEQLPRNMKFSEAMEAGCFLVAGDRNKVVLGYGVAISLDLRVGDDIEVAIDLGFASPSDFKNVGDEISIDDTLGNHGKYEVAGILKNKVQIYSTDLLITSNDDAREFFGYKKNEASDILVYLDEGGSADRVALAISLLRRNTRVMTAKSLTNLVKEAFARRSGTFQAMWLILFLSVLMFAWAQTTHIGVDAGKEIGILKSVGWQTGDIIMIKMMESLLYGLTGTTLGVLSGLIYALMGTPGMSGYCIGCASVYPKFPVPVSCDVSSILLLFLTGVIPVTLITAIPAWLAGTVDPDMAIRSCEF